MQAIAGYHLFKTHVIKTFPRSDKIFLFYIFKLRLKSGFSINNAIFC